MEGRAYNHSKKHKIHAFQNMNVSPFHDFNMHRRRFHDMIKMYYP